MADDKTPPDIATGSFVSWSDGKGRVDLVVRSGKVPGVESEVEATSESPAVRVVVWVDGKPTPKKIAASTHTLKRIAPLDKDEKKSDPNAALVILHRDHARMCEEDQRPDSVDLTGEAVKTAFDRGVESWPGEEATTLTAEEWGLGRAEHLCKAARGETEVSNDVDLLHKDHPMAPQTVTVDAAEMQAKVDAIMADAAPE